MSQVTGGRDRPVPSRRDDRHGESSSASKGASRMRTRATPHVAYDPSSSSSTSFLSSSPPFPSGSSCTSSSGTGGGTTSATTTSSSSTHPTSSASTPDASSSALAAPDPFSSSLPLTPANKFKLDQHPGSSGASSPAFSGQSSHQHHPASDPYSATQTSRRLSRANRPPSPSSPRSRPRPPSSSQASSSASSAYSYRSSTSTTGESADLLGPLPAHPAPALKGIAERESPRPAFIRGFTVPDPILTTAAPSSSSSPVIPLSPTQALTHTHTPTTTATTTTTTTTSKTNLRIPLPSPPALGISELLSGSPFTPPGELSYFALPTSRSEPPASINRSASFGSSSRKTPAFSPFVSYYGEVRGHRKGGSSSSDFKQLAADFGYIGPPAGPRSSMAGGGGAAEEHEPESTVTGGTTARALSDPPLLVSSMREPRGVRAPKVKNIDPRLAPHGSFTSARARPSPSSTNPLASPGSNATSSDGASGSGRSKTSQQHLKERRSSRGSFSGLRASESESGREPLSEDERAVLLRAASKGDQLAMYKLGWRPERSGGRYNLGAVENVWGPRAEPGMSSPSFQSTRSSMSDASPSYFTLQSGGASSGSPAPASPMAKDSPVGDLFADAARMTLQDNALHNVRRASGGARRSSLSGTGGAGEVVGADGDQGGVSGGRRGDVQVDDGLPTT